MCIRDRPRMALETVRLECRRGKGNSQCSGEMRRYWEEHQWRRRLSGPVSYTHLRIAEQGTPEDARRWAYQTAMELETIGFNVNFAPVLDLSLIHIFASGRAGNKNFQAGFFYSFIIGRR